MNAEQQLIAIAEGCGWKWVVKSGISVKVRNGTLTHVGVPPDAPTNHPVFVPDYLNDLNAMHEAINSLNYQDGIRFMGHLSSDGEIRGVEWLIVNATAAQRAKAFLRTLGKWRD